MLRKEMIYMSNSFLMHYGVPGQKWGVYSEPAVNEYDADTI